MYGADFGSTVASVRTKSASAQHIMQQMLLDKMDNSNPLIVHT